MLQLPLNLISAKAGADVRLAASYGAAILHAIARDEAAGRRPPRLTEPDQRTWQRFRHLLGPRHFLQLLAEDAAVNHRVPFDANAVFGERGLAGRPLDLLDDDVVGKWLESVAELDLRADSVDYVQAQARLLGIPDRMARSDLHKAQPHHKILELPGTGGQLSHYLAVRDGIYLQDNVTIACGNANELILAGLVADELGAPDAAAFAHVDPDLDFARDDSRRTGYHVVVGRTPENGGRYARERLLELFPNANVVLV